MARLKEITPEEASGNIEKIYNELKADMGKVPNQFKHMATSFVGTKAYLDLEKLLEENGELNPLEQEVARIVVSDHNGCKYCLSAHTARGKQMGLDEDEIVAIRKGESPNKRYAALAEFIPRVIDTKGHVSDEDITRFKAADFNDGHIGEVLTIIAQKTLSNYFNHVNDTEVDFPEAPEV